MPKTISVAQLGHGGASRAVREAEQEPVLVSKNDRPAAWIVGAGRLAEIAQARGVEPDVYQHALELLALDLYQREILALGQAAKLAGLSLGDFVDLCARLKVPVLWEPRAGVGVDVERLDRTLRDEGAA